MKLYNAKAFRKTAINCALLTLFCATTSFIFNSCGPDISPITVSVSENAMRIIDPPQSSITWSEPVLPISWDLQQLLNMAESGWYIRTGGNEVLTYQVTKVVNVDDFSQRRSQ